MQTAAYLRKLICGLKQVLPPAIQEVHQLSPRLNPGDKENIPIRKETVEDWQRGTQVHDGNNNGGDVNENEEGDDKTNGVLSAHTFKKEEGLKFLAKIVTTCFDTYLECLDLDLPSGWELDANLVSNVPRQP
jgi:hypothetical protein